jgi:hypothetical protein
MANVNAPGWSEVLAHVCACGGPRREAGGRKFTSENSRRLQPPNLDEAYVTRAEMCPDPAPVIDRTATRL